MSQFYRVTFKTRQMISIVVGKGKKQTTRQEERFLTQTHGGLPMSTCLAYKEKCPDAVIERDYDYTGFDSKQRTRVTQGGERRAAPAPRKAPSPAPKPAPAAVVTGGDYADLVNKMVAKGAAA